MDPILERFNRLLKSMFVDTDDINFGYNDFSDSVDSDYAEAWDELNDFLSSPGSNGFKRSDTFNNSVPATPEILRADYLNMGVPFGSDFTVTKNAYKKLIIKNHPDKNTINSEILNKATEKTKILNISFQKIKAWEQAKQG
jgi:DnaJ-domain-containing protein 1